MKTFIHEAAKKIKESRHTIALTGAGISVESGIPPFRGKGSLWEKYDPTKYAEINYFLKNPGEVWEIFLKDMKKTLEKAKPNAGHTGLADLEKKGLLSTIITQNIDGLHQRAGSSDVIEFHGSFAKFYCLECSNIIDVENINIEKMPPRCEKCNGIYRPDCVFFGEMIPADCLSRSSQEASQSDVILVIGTSALVQPAASIPSIAKTSGACVIEINPEPTPLTNGVADITLNGGAGKIISLIIEEINRL
ncbi:MAG: RNA polymerase subunit sigma [Deltaproteobacteria bacterium]|nr:MAG: RNA polymerase subunit sigma [Deltaproteobacteria bacterium]